MKVKHFYLLLLILCFPISSIAKEIIKKEPKTRKKHPIEFFAYSQSWSNILPVKQLLKDEWQQVPNSSASKGFTQNEFGARIYWKNFSFSTSHRYDYFVFSNSDTAKAFYLERSDLALDTLDAYNLDLKLLHQRSNGLRLGYKFKLNNFTIEPRLGYWSSSSTRESYLTGTLSSGINGNISGLVQMREFYSHRNFLRRRNVNNDWNTGGTGLTFDVHMFWQPTEDITLLADLKDIYSDFSLDRSGYSEGKVDTEGTFINSVGGIAYLPLYRGKEVEEKHQFELPEQVDIIGFYHSKQLSYLARYKRQGEQNFYYLGFEVQHQDSSTRISLDIENIAAEIQYKNNWLSLIFAIDNTDIEQALQLNLGLSVNYSF